MSFVLVAIFGDARLLERSYMEQLFYPLKINMLQLFPTNFAKIGVSLPNK